MTGEGLAELRDLPRLSRFDLESTKVADASLAALAGLTALARLNLAGTAITDAGLACLRGPPEPGTTSARFDRHRARRPVRARGFPALFDLDLESAQVTDAGLAALGRLPGLRYLNLNRCPITDAGLAHLEPLSGLRSLRVAATGVTRKGIRKLREAIRSAQIDQASKSGGQYELKYINSSLFFAPLLSEALPGSTTGLATEPNADRSRSDRILMEGTRGTMRGLWSTAADRRGKLAYPPSGLAKPRRS